MGQLLTMPSAPDSVVLVEGGLFQHFLLVLLGACSHTPDVSWYQGNVVVSWQAQQHLIPCPVSGPGQGSHGVDRGDSLKIKCRQLTKLKLHWNIRQVLNFINSFYIFPLIYLFIEREGETERDHRSTSWGRGREKWRHRFYLLGSRLPSMWDLVPEPQDHDLVKAELSHPGPPLRIYFKYIYDKFSLWQQ